MRSLAPLRFAAASLGLFAVAGCSKSNLAPSPDLASLLDLAPPPSDLAWNKMLVVQRPYLSKVPSGYLAGHPTPLVLALHGLGDGGASFASGVGLLQLADAQTFLVAYPDGSPTGFGGGYWNANDVCCALSNPVPDDVAYLNAVLSDMSERYSVDPRRIFVVGLSNGGMMAHRLGCDLSWRVAAFVSLSGAQWDAAEHCQPSQPVAALEVHGTKDTTVPYNGGLTLNGLGPKVNSAHATIQVWVDRNGCGMAPDTSAPPLDLDGSIAGKETTLENWKGCRTGGAAELWTINGGMHVPRLNAGAPVLFYNWLMTHAR